MRFKIGVKRYNMVVSTTLSCQLEELTRWVKYHSDMTFEESQKLVEKFTNGSYAKAYDDTYTVTLEVAE